ncbi:MAG: ABC transporter permease [Candidatus Eisenbacteria bacterium]
MASRSSWANIRVMTRFDLQFMLRSRETLMWMFLMPVLFMFLIGKAMPGSSMDPDQEPTFAILDLDHGPLAETFVRHLDDLGYAIVRVDAESTLTRYARRLEIPAGLSQRALAGEVQSVELGFKNLNTRANLDRVRVNRALFQTLGDLAVVATEGDSVSTASLRSIGERPRAVTLEAKPAGRRLEIPTGFSQSVPGILVMFVLMVSLTTGGVVLVIEREEGLLRRLASAPVTRREIVIAKTTSRVLLGLIQTGFAMLVGSLPPFRIQWGGQLPAVLLLLAIYTLSTASLSVLLGSFARSRGQAVGTGVLGANLLAALGGCWWPIEVTGPVMQKLAWCLPTGWVMYGLHRLLSFGDSIASIVPSLLLLVASAIVFGWLAGRSFRFQ